MDASRFEFWVRHFSHVAAVLASEKVVLATLSDEQLNDHHEALHVLKKGLQQIKRKVESNLLSTTRMLVKIEIDKEKAKYTEGLCLNS